MQFVQAHKNNRIPEATLKKEIIVVDKEKGILRCTTVGERWYIRDLVDPKTAESKPEFVPSVTWICDSFPKGPAYWKWLASKGWDEALAIKTAAGDRGSRVHKAIQDLIEGREVPIDAKYPSSSDDEPKELTFEEYDAILSFARWYEEVKPELIAWEFVVWGDGYAGTVDLLCSIGGQKYIVDFKTSAHIWPSHELQVSAYKHALNLTRPAPCNGPTCKGEKRDHDSNCNVSLHITEPEDVKLAILQVGYRMNKKKFKLTEIDDQYQEFLAAKVIWAREQKGVEPKQREYPMSVRLDQGEKHETTAETKDGVRESAEVR